MILTVFALSESRENTKISYIFLNLVCSKKPTWSIPRLQLILFDSLEFVGYILEFNFSKVLFFSIFSAFSFN